MKKQAIALAALAGMIMGVSLAQGADSKGSGIVGSVHDLSSNNTVASVYGIKNDPGQRICAFCHSPHHSLNDNQQESASVANLDGNAAGTTYKVYAPLWSRTDLDKVTGYGTYISQTFNPANQNKPYDPLIGPSRLCLTCHDGSIALDAYYGNTNTTTNTTGDLFNGPMGGGGPNSIGIAGGMMGLSNDHPIGMKYSDYQGQNDPNGNPYELRVDSTNFQTTDGVKGKTISSVLYSDPVDPNVKGFVTCASCHDVHNGTAVGNKNPSGSMRGFLLYGSQKNSSFCLTCHDKNPTVNPHSALRRSDRNPPTSVSLDRSHVYARNLEVPAGGGVGTARALARAYGVFATGGDELGLRQETLQALMAPAVPPAHGFFDECLKLDWQLSLGFARPSRHGLDFGSPSAFGMPGWGGALAYADPEVKAGYAYVTNRMGAAGADPREIAIRTAFHRALERQPSRTTTVVDSVQPWYGKPAREVQT